MRDALCSIHYQSRACRRAWGLLSVSLAAPPRLTKYRVRVRVGLNCGTTCSEDPLGRETKRASLGASVPPCRLAALPPALLETGRRCAQVARDGRAVQHRAHALGGHGGRHMEARVRRRGTCTPPHRLRRRRRRRQARDAPWDARPALQVPGRQDKPTTTAKHGTRMKGLTHA